METRKIKVVVDGSSLYHVELFHILGHWVSVTDRPIPLCDAIALCRRIAKW